MNIYVTNVDIVNEHVTYKSNENRTSQDAFKAFPQTLTYTTNQKQRYCYCYLHRKNTRWNLQKNLSHEYLFMPPKSTK
jgi:hypothetical protein